MRHLRSNTAYLLFPIAGILAALLIPYDRLALRVLVGGVISGLGVLAADAGFTFGDLPGMPVRLRAYFGSRPRSRTAARFAALALLLMSLAALLFSPDNKREAVYTLPALLMFGGAAALWAAVRFDPPAAQIAETTAEPLTPSRGSLPLTVIGVLLLLLTGEIAGRALGIQMLSYVSLPLQGLFFYSGIALVVLGLGGIGDLRLPSLPPDALRSLRPRRAWLRPAFWRGTRGEVAAIALIFCAALLLRAWNLETGLRVSVDEALAIDGTMHYFGGAIGLVGRPSEYITTLLMPQWQGELIHLMGRSVTSLRLISAFVGALTVVVTYFLARDLFRDRRTGVIAALFLLALPPHLHFSRIGLIHIADPLFGSLGIWFLIRGLRFNRRIDWALAGASLALTQYFFEAGRLFYIPLVAAWFLGAAALSLLDRLRLRRRFDMAPARLPFKGIFVALLALILVATPVYYAIFSRNRDANPRLTTSGGFDLILAPFQDDDGLTGEEASALARRILFPFSVYVSQPEQAAFYGGRQPLLLVYVVPFFLMGTAFLLACWRSAAVILVLWVLLTALTNALLRDSAVYARWHVVFPAAAVVTAVGVRTLLPMLFPRPVPSLTLEVARNAPAANVAPQRAELPTPAGAPASRWASAVVIGVTALLLIGQVNYYYALHVPAFERQAREFKPYPDGYDAAIRAAGVPNYTDIYLIANPIPDINVPRIWIAYLTQSDVATLRYFPLAAEDFTEEFVETLPEDRHLALFIDNQSPLAILTAVNAFGCSIENSPYEIAPPTKEYVLCFVDRGFTEAVG